MDTNLWKEPGELKKYLENLGIEYRFGCYHENRPEVCHLLGDYLTSIDTDHPKAAQVYKKNCDENQYGLSCDAYGRLAYRGQGVHKSLPSALEYFIKGCDQREHRSCFHGAQLLGNEDKQLNKVIPPDPDRAISMLWTSCLSGKLGAACTNIHSMYLSGFHGRPPDLEKAYKYGLIGCDQDELVCCHNLARMHRRGDGVEKDKDKVKYFLGRVMDITQHLARKGHTVQSDSKGDL